MFKCDSCGYMILSSSKMCDSCKKPVSNIIDNYVNKEKIREFLNYSIEDNKDDIDKYGSCNYLGNAAGAQIDFARELLEKLEDGEFDLFKNAAPETESGK